MVFITEEMIKQLQILVEKVDEPLKKTFQNMHNGYPRETLERFLKARDGNVSNAHKMLIDCLNWRVQNEIDNILAENRDPPARQTGSSILADFDGYEMRFGKLVSDNPKFPFNWKKRSIFFDLPYWEDNLLPHNLDVMHITKNVCESIVGTLLDIDGKTKDHLKSRRDLKEMGIRKELHPKETEAGSIKFFMPPVCFVLDKKEKERFCKVLKTVKIPDGKFVFSRPSKVTDTLLKYITASEIPVVYGGLRRENDPEFSVEDAASEVIVKANATGVVEIPVPEVGNTLMWDLTIVGWDVNYKEEFVPTDEGSYMVIVKRRREISWQQEPIRNTFKIKEPGKIVITVDNGIFKKKCVLYRYKSIPSST